VANDDDGNNIINNTTINTTRRRRTGSAILNIVIPESKILASRERCPFLLHVEVTDTGLEGSSACMYASGATGLGSTIEEALSMQDMEGATSAMVASRERPQTKASPFFGYSLDGNSAPVHPLAYSFQCDFVGW
jgi:hypothetical protein